MRTSVRIRLVFNQKSKPLSDTDKAPIKYEVRFTDGKKYYIDSGYVIEKRQWDPSGMITGHPLAGKLNKALQDFILLIRTHELSAHERALPFTIESLRLALENKSSGIFTTWAEKEIRSREDIAEYTRYTHLKAVAYLAECGITSFDELTTPNILRFDTHLKGKKLHQTTIAKLHKVIKAYIRRAEAKDIFSPGKNPYTKFKIEMGRHAVRRRFDGEELVKFMGYAPTDDLAPIHAIACFILHTGITYNDVMALTYERNLRRNSDGVWIEGLRKKTGEFFNIPLLADAVKILDKRNPGNGHLLAMPHRQKFNEQMQSLCRLAGVKVITSHELRHSAASSWVRAGVDLEAIRDMLGHTDIRTSEIYAKLEGVYLRKQFEKMGKV